MTEHNKITFVEEYCKCRKIPCKFKGEQFTIGNLNGYPSTVTFFSAYNFTYKDLIDEIDKYVKYNEFGDYAGINDKEVLK